jgi:hypothetical protein
MASDPSFPSDDDGPAAESDEPFSPSAQITAITGLLIAFLSLGAPLAAVITDRSIVPSRLIPTSLDRHGSPQSPPITITRLGRPSR